MTEVGGSLQEDFGQMRQNEHNPGVDQASDDRKVETAHTLQYLQYCKV